MPRLFLSFRFLSLFALIALTAPGLLSASGWPHFRGPDFDGTAVAEWPDPAEFELAWRIPLGIGYSGIVVSGDRLYTGFGDGDADWLGAFDADSGAELWRVRLGAVFPAFGGSHGGPSATPALGAGLIFGVGGHGSLVAVRPDGHEVWRQDLEEWAHPAPPWGFASSPIVLEEGIADPLLLIQTPGRDGRLLFALDPATGEPLWSVGNSPSVYQTPIRTRLAGHDQIVVSGVKALYGVSLEGDVLWTFDYPPAPPAPKGVQSSIPVAIGGDRVLVTPKPTEVLAVQVRRDPDCVAASSDTASSDTASSDTASTFSGEPCPLIAEAAWSSPHFARSYVPPMLYQGVVYGYRSSNVSALDADSGELLWRSRSPGDGFFAAADDRMVVLTKRGSLHLGMAGRQGWEEEARLQVFSGASWTEPTIVQNSIFVRSVGEMARVDLRPATAAEVAESDWIDFGRPGAELPDTGFGRFVRSLETTDDRQAAVDEFLAGVDGFPLVEDEWVHFVFRGPQPDIGVSGDMVGERAEFDMVKVPGTDLFYFTSKLPRDARASYLFFTEPSEAGVLDPLNPRTTYWPREGSVLDRKLQRYSVFQMSEAKLPGYLEGEPEEEGRIETHSIALADLGVEVHPPPAVQHFIAKDPAADQRIRVYLPAGHDPQRAEPYPVVYVFAGERVLEGLDAKRTLDHLLGDELPAAVVVFVDRHYEFLVSDSSWSFELHRRSLFERIMPLVRSRYGAGGDTYFLGFGYGGPIVLSTALAPESTASRIAMVQPFVLDVTRPPLIAGIAQVPPERRPEVYLETSRIDLRGAHETWDIAEEQGKVVEALRAEGWQVTRGTNSCGFFWSAWRDRLGPALAFLLTGEARVPGE